jgi:hypothetical protein
MKTKTHTKRNGQRLLLEAHTSTSYAVEWWRVGKWHRGAFRFFEAAAATGHAKWLSNRGKRFPRLKTHIVEITECERVMPDVPAVAVQGMVRRLATSAKKPDVTKYNDPTMVVISDLRALLFWATIGIGKSRGGYQQHEIENIIESYADFLKFQLPRKPKFMRERRKE